MASIHLWETRIMWISLAKKDKPRVEVVVAKFST